MTRLFFFAQQHPDVEIVTGCIDKGLTESSDVTPGKCLLHECPGMLTYIIFGLEKTSPCPKFVETNQSSMIVMHYRAFRRSKYRVFNLLYGGDFVNDDIFMT
jgi:hypothetical protein